MRAAVVVVTVVAVAAARSVLGRALLTLFLVLLHGVFRDTSDDRSADCTEEAVVGLVTGEPTGKTACQSSAESTFTVLYVARRIWVIRSGTEEVSIWVLYITRQQVSRTPPDGKIHGRIVAGRADRTEPGRTGVAGHTEAVRTGAEVDPAGIVAADSPGGDPVGRSPEEGNHPGCTGRSSGRTGCCCCCCRRTDPTWLVV